MTTRELNQQIETGDSLKSIAQSYSELASLKLKKIRSQVETNKKFYGEISRVYALVNKIAGAKGVIRPKKSKKNVTLLLTSNNRFYGNINSELVKFFIVQSTKIPAADKLVVGKTGKDYLTSMHYFHPFEAMLFKNDLPNNLELKSLTSKLQQYEQILVFYPEFISVLNQKPIIKDITQSQNLTLTQAANIAKLDVSFIFSQKEFQQAAFIFEPEILKMLDFFDGQIKILLLEQTLLEAELSRTASRLIAMDQAQNKASDFIKDLHKQLNLLKRTSTNNQSLETIAGVLNFQHHHQLFK